MKISQKLLLTALIASATTIGSSAHAQVLASDNFTNSSGSNVGTVNNTQSLGVGTYNVIQGAAAGMTVTTLAGFGSGNVLSLANNTKTYYRAFNGAATLTLSSLTANQTLRLAFNVRFDGTFANTADDFSFGFINQSTPNSVIYANLDLDHSDTNVSEFRYRTGSFDMGGTGSIALTPTWTEPAIATATSYAFQLDITKQSNGDFVIGYFRDGSLVASNTQLSGNAFATTQGGLAISGVAFRWAGIPGVTTALDNVTASVVPEPTTGSLLMGGVGLLALMRRRHRRI